MTLSTDALRDALRDALAERYTIERELGAGGMATVYLANDRRHDRPVAIKVLQPELAAAVGAERFAREIRVLARLRHPFILPLHDSGEVSGRLYYVMPFVDGESLGARLRRTGRLPVREAVQIAREIADALAYAHSEGVVHRDVKPENILISRQGHALLADFGIARGGARSPRDHLTGVGLTIGTPAYMSPEQAMGEANVGGASDIYSLGVTLYEMLAGRPPFISGSAATVAMQHLTALVPPLASVGAAAPPNVEQAVLRALAKEPEARFATAAELAAALELSGPQVVTAPAEPVSPPAASVVVLPLANVSGDKESEYLSDGITEELIGALARVSGLRVISRTSAFAFKGKSVPLREIGNTLNVSFALEGGVRRAGERLRVTAQLIRVSDDSSLWSETYERELADVFAVQDDIARRIVTTLTRTLRVTPVDTPEPIAKPRSLEAYNDYLLGRYHWNKRTGPGFQQALELFQKAIAADPSFAPAHSGLADAAALMASNGYGPQDLFSTAAAAARRALELDSSLAEGHASLGFVMLRRDWDFAGAERELRRALELNSSYVPAYLWLSAYYAAVGRSAEALPLALRALELDPLSILSRVNLGTIYMFADRLDEAEQQYQQAVAMEPGFASAQVWLAITLAARGSAEAAIAHARIAVDLEPDDPGAEGILAAVYAILGRREEAEAIVTHISSVPDVYPLFIAMIYAALGREDEMFEWLERSYASRINWLYSIGAQPVFAPYRTHPRFVALLQRMGVPAVTLAKSLTK